MLAVAFGPWSYPGEVVRGVVSGQVELAWCVAGAAGGLLFAAFAGWSFARRDVF